MERNFIVFKKQIEPQTKVSKNIIIAKYIIRKISKNIIIPK